MLTAPEHPNESKRLEALRELAPVASGKDPLFDDLTCLAQCICKTPISLLSLIDHHHQKTKSAQGIAFHEIPRTVSICAHTILRPGIFEIRDARKDPDFSDHPWVVDAPRIRFYAGISLVSSDGSPVGAICVMGTEPGHLDHGQRTSLGILAQHASSLLETRCAELKSAKLASLGELTAGVAHEINNPLAIALANLNHLERLLEEGEASPPERKLLRDKIAAAEKTLRRVAGIVNGLRLFSRDASLDPKEPFRLSSMIEETLSLFQERIKSNGVDLRLRIERDGIVPGRAAQISQVLLNLISNSLDAIEQKPNPWIRLEASARQSDAILSVTDSGNGIPRPVQERIMQPFFTTKKAGKGTGLGLSISKRIIEEHGGKLSYDGHSPHTRFVIELPGFEPIPSGTSRSP